MRVPATALALGALAASGAVGASRLGKAPRFQHTMEIVNGQLCVFGGKGTTTGTKLSEFQTDYRCVDVTKAIDQADPGWRHQSSASRFAMPPLAQHSSVYSRASHIIVPYGGQLPVTFSQANQLSVYCTLYQAWGASTAVDSQPRRYLHTAVLQESSGDMLIFGGTTDNTTYKGDGSRFNKVGRLVTDTVRHAQRQRRLGLGTNDMISVGTVLTDDGGETPELINNLVQHASVMLNDTTMLVLGGNVYDGSLPLNQQNVMRPFSTVYLYNVDRMTWSAQDCTGTVPPSRGVVAVAERNGYVWIHGGVDVNSWSTMFDDLHELDTRTWTWKKLAAPGSPAPRYAHQMKALGHYLIITHGFIAETLGNGTVVEHGDPDIYFYDLNRRSFVDRYSPQGISARELDTEWLVARTGATNGVSALCFLLVLAVALAAAYYLVREVRAMLRQRVRVRARPQRPAAERGALRSMVDSYAETLRQSAFLGDGGKSGRASLDGGASQEAPAGRRSFALVRVKEAPEGHVVNPPTASEGATTVVGSSESGAGPARSQSTRALQATMRHARILDASPGETPYVSRKLTLSAHLPAYRAPRPAARHQVVRFSEHQDADDAAASGAESDVASDGDGSISSRPTTESDDLDAALASPPETPSTHSDTADAAAGLDADEDEAAPLRLMNVEADSR